MTGEIISHILGLRLCNNVEIYINEKKSIVMKPIDYIIIILLYLTIPLYAAEKQREKIGEAMGTPIYRDQIDESRDLYIQ
ncbi:MAG: hypothetical protein A2Y97_01290 [Nitrospirae bacterium RBG_13_39_12]|nr:MAG: hypothetical protein A2Y97_01290 [Nitrospirae bacterium RBG_13_39_12]